MSKILDYISTWSILKWVALVLIAGFIGQFGKMLAQTVVDRVRRRRAEKQDLPETAKPKEVMVHPPDNNADAIRSISLLSGTSASVNYSPTQDASTVVPDKKKLKAMAKVRKKEAKKKDS
jgi:hypothetical protein